MSKNKPNVEILAPAGSIEQLVAAVNNGCDSVYLGLDCFNARMKAPNFTLENVAEWIDYCHLYGVKVYVALNTSLKNDEFDNAAKMLLEVYKRNADGVIVTDLALMRLAASFPKPFEVVASTQLNAHDEFGAEFLKKNGATTVVCARESSLEEIKAIVATGVKTECFIHGATCVCQSGQCLFSSIVGGNSGNRGLCAQPCRKLYSSNVSDEKSYLLSARDLCGLDVAQKMYDAGVEVYKIEGRNRRAEYAGLTSRAYKKLFSSNFTRNGNDLVDLEEMYNRAMGTLSYLYGDNADIIYPYAQNHLGAHVGFVKNGGVIAEKEIARGDGLKVFDGRVEFCGAIALQSGTGYVKAEFDKKVRDGMEVRRTTSMKLCQEILAAKKKLPATLYFKALPDEQVVLRAQCENASVTYQSDFKVSQAKANPTTLSEVAEQLKKTGDTPFTISDIVIELENVFLAKSQINSLRRAVLQMLSEEIVKSYNGRFAVRNQIDNTALAGACEKAIDTSTSDYNSVSDQHADNCALAVVCYSKDELLLAKNRAKYLVFRPHVINFEILSEIEGVDCFIDLPSFSDNKYLSELFKKKKFGVVCHNVGHVEMARRLCLPYIAGSGLNIYNDRMAHEFSDAVTFVYSHELTLREIAQFENQNGLIFVDGKLTLMKLAHCPYKVAYKCNCANCKADSPLSYTDELRNRFDFCRRRDGRCTFELMNGKKLSVTGKLVHSGRYMIDYNEKVLTHYVNLNNGIIDDFVETEPYTKGRLYSKVN